MDKARVIKDHAQDSPISLIIKEGDILHGERRTTDWDGWIWCTSGSGASVWVPEVFLSKLPEGDFYRVTRDYDSRELEIRAGQEVEILSMVSGWAWILTKDDGEGWIPLENLMQQPK